LRLEKALSSAKTPTQNTKIVREPHNNAEIDQK